MGGGCSGVCMALIGPIHVAPMMEVTDRWFRQVHRLWAPGVVQWTEMVVGHAVLHGDRHRVIGFDPSEHPVVVQLGGDDPAVLAQAARIVEDAGYDEINLNVGCPSSRVRAGAFGAILMRRPDRVARVVEAMRSAVSIPVHVKHRIGVDELDAYEDMLRFVDTVASAGCDTFYVHARKAWLQGLSPKENRTVPPLRHDEVHRLKAERPHLTIVTNGGITTDDAVDAHLAEVDGVMIGRAAADDPWWMASLSQRILRMPGPATRLDAIEVVRPVIARAVAEGRPPHAVTRHLVHLFANQPGTRRWRRALSEHRHDPDGGLDAAVAELHAAMEAA